MKPSRTQDYNSYLERAARCAGQSRDGVRGRIRRVRNPGTTPVAAGLRPAVKPGILPGGQNGSTRQSLKIPSLAETCTLSFRATGCRPLRQAGRLTLRAGAVAGCAGAVARDI